jgi:hypothetical protein
MHPRSLLPRRPSAPMAISLVALFMSIGGVGWAATQLPAGSVGTTQLRNGAVTSPKLANGSVGNFKLGVNSVGFRKIIEGTVGIRRINPTTVQARVSGTCPAGQTAITAIAQSGKVTCASAPPPEFGASTTSPVSVTSSTSAATILTKALPSASSYLALATPYVQVSSAVPNQHVAVTCTLAAGPATTATQTRSVTVDFGPGSTPPDQAASIPLVATPPSSTSAITASVSCTRSFQGGTTAPTVKVSTSINAIQTASNN